MALNLNRKGSSGVNSPDMINMSRRQSRIGLGFKKSLHYTDRNTNFELDHSLQIIDTSNNADPETIFQKSDSDK